MSISRRRFIKRTFAFSAAALLGEARFALSADSVTADPSNEAAQHFLAVGNYGVVQFDLARQQAVASAMIKYTETNRFQPEAMFMLGDNFYGGLAGKGLKSGRWKMTLEDMYPAASFPGPMYAMLGNHDYNDEGMKASVWAQLHYRSSNPTVRWTLPSKWYRLELPPKSPGGRSLATILVLDTNFSYRDAKMVDDAERQKQLDWLAAEFDKPRTAPWLFVFGHHPVYRAGKHGDTEELVNSLEPMLKKAKVDLYLCGHDHDLQHLEVEGHPTSFVVSGAGGARTRTAPPDERGPFFKAIYGFSHMELRPSSFTIRHIDANGNLLHAFTRALNGKITNFA